MSEQLNAWFTDPLGIPHVALGGYASQTFCTQVRRFVESEDRPALLIYAGDHDPSGVDIDRDFEKRVGVFDKVVRVALSPEQVEEYDLPLNNIDAVTEKLKKDPRSKKFVERFGELVQYEVDALDPEVLRDLYRTVIEAVWNPDAFEMVMDRESEDRALLRERELPS